MEYRFDDEPQPPSASKIDERYMQEALNEAGRASDEGEVPVGAVIVHDGRIIARAHNQREILRDPTAHAEMIAITQAAAALENWRLMDADIYVTLEPCPMCAGALVVARVRRLIYGADDPKAGACGTVLNVLDTPELNHRVAVTAGVLSQECGQTLSDFFRARREEMK